MTRVDAKEEFLIYDSRAYVKKCNLVCENVVVDCWQVRLRKQQYDVFASVVRRKYIPPLMETYQDVFVIS